MSDVLEPPAPSPPPTGNGQQFRMSTQISAWNAMVAGGAMVFGAVLAVFVLIVGFSVFYGHRVVSQAPTAAPPSAPVMPIVRGVYPSETEISFLQACEAGASAPANAKCNCDLSQLESNVSLDRLLAIESDTSTGRPLPDDVLAMFATCRTQNA